MYTNLAPSTSALPCFPFSSMRRRAVVVKAVSVSTFAADATAPGKNFSLYEVLRVKRTASPTEIKTAYRSLAKMYHPDAVIRQRVDESADGKDFIEIHNAYETLSDPAMRAVYDLSLAATIGGGSYYRRMRGGGGGGCHTTRRWETDQCW